MGAEKKEPRPGYWAVIPATVRYDDRIPASAKVLYAELSSLAEESGYCWAENSYFARVYKMTEKSIREQLHALEDAGYIRIEEQRGNHNVLLGRQIYVGLNPLLAAPPPEPLNEKVSPLNEKVQRDLIKKTNTPPIIPQDGTKTPRATESEIAAAIREAAGGSPELLAAWQDFSETRKAKRAPIKTLRTVELLTDKLEKLSHGDAAVKIAILEQSVERSWTGLFPLKETEPALSATGGYWAED